MSHFPDDAFNLEELRDAPSADSLQPGDLEAIQHALRVQGHLERGVALRRLTREVLGPAGLGLPLHDEVESLLDQCDQGENC